MNRYFGIQRKSRCGISSRSALLANIKTIFSKRNASFYRTFDQQPLKILIGQYQYICDNPSEWVDKFNNTRLSISCEGIIRESEKTGKSYAVFSIRVWKKRNGEDEEIWDVYRRYSDFHDLQMIMAEKVAPFV